MSQAVTDQFTDFIADALTSYIAGESEIHDFIVRADEGIVYVEVEAGELWLIRVDPAKVQVAESDRTGK